MHYLKTYCFILLFTSILLTGCHTQKSNEFVLEVYLEEAPKEVTYLVLRYHDYNGDYVRDTLPLQDSRITFTGKINGAVFVSLLSNLGSAWVEDPNHLSFFIDPGKTSVRLQSNNFKNAKIKASATQNQFLELNKLLEGITQEQKVLVNERNKLIQQKYTSNNPKEIDERLEKLHIKHNEMRAKKTDIEIQFIRDNPDSYVSVYELYGRSNYNSIPMDLIEELYQSLSNKVKKSTYSKRILQNIENYKQSRIGSQATNFTAQDPSGKSISLADFKGKYVLLDFWAGWCKPCKEDQPLIKKMYNEYHKEGLEIIGVSYDRSREAWLQAIKKEELGSWHHVLDDFKNMNVNTIGQTFKVKPIPAYILIDPRGIIAGRYAAADGNRQNTLEDLEQDLKDIFE